MLARVTPSNRDKFYENSNRKDVRNRHEKDILILRHSQCLLTSFTQCGARRDPGDTMKSQALVLTAIVMSAICSAPAFAAPDAAQPATADLMPPASSPASLPPGSSLDGETHPALKLTPDKSELVRLDREASSVIVGNPAQVAVMLDTPRLAVVIPRASGATYFTVLDKDGNVIMQRHVIVASPKKNYVRVRRSCSNAGQNAECQPTSVYFCPDMCHEVSATSGEDSASAAPAGTVE